MMVRAGDEASDIAAISVRPSARVGRVAEILDCNESDVRRMIKTGEVDAHRIGKRGVRVFLDSVFAYQERRVIQPAAAHAETRPPARRRSRGPSASYLAAVEGLRRAGIVR